MIYWRPEVALSRPVEVQLGIFGGTNEIAAMHTVAAHTRVQPDGTEVFVGEHLRWNRGRQTPARRAPRVPTRPTEGHPTLFGQTARPEPEATETKRQLRLW